jgi:acyl carrier protein
MYVLSGDRPPHRRNEPDEGNPMRTVADLIGLANDELGLALAPQDATTPLTDLAEWDSLNLLRLVAVLEEATGHPVPLSDLLDAPTLAEIWSRAVRA